MRSNSNSTPNALVHYAPIVTLAAIAAFAVYAYNAKVARRHAAKPASGSSGASCGSSACGAAASAWHPESAAAANAVAAEQRARTSGCPNAFPEGPTAANAVTVPVSGTACDGFDESEAARMDELAREISQRSAGVFAGAQIDASAARVPMDAATVGETIYSAVNFPDAATSFDTCRYRSPKVDADLTFLPSAMEPSVEGTQLEESYSGLAIRPLEKSGSYELLTMPVRSEG